MGLIYEKIVDPAIVNVPAHLSSGAGLLEKLIIQNNILGTLTLLSKTCLIISVNKYLKKISSITIFLFTHRII